MFMNLDIQREEEEQTDYFKSIDNHEIFHDDWAYCSSDSINKYKFDFLVYASQLKGYAGGALKEGIEGYYVKIRNNIQYCLVIDQNCTCNTLENRELRARFVSSKFLF
jgi:hypothetical protein